MSRSLLQWVVDEVEVVETIAIVLHRAGGSARSRAWDLGAHVKQYHPWSPRPLSPRGGHDQHHGFIWYFEHEGVIENGHFAEHLRQLELMLFDVVEAEPAGLPIWLVGEGQGAALALALGGYWPELVKGIIAFGADVPQVDGWTSSNDRLGQRIISDRPLVLPGAEVRVGPIDLNWLNTLPG